MMKAPFSITSVAKSPRPVSERPIRKGPSGRLLLIFTKSSATSERSCQFHGWKSSIDQLGHEAMFSRSKLAKGSIVMPICRSVPAESGLHAGTYHEGDAETECGCRDSG